MKLFRKRLSDVQVALMLLTRLPAGRLKGAVPGLEQAIWAYPLVGLILGTLSFIIHSLCGAIGLPSIVCAWAALGGLALMTGGLHFDGLADFADGIGGGQNKAHSLDIMRDSRIGSYGVLALLITTGLWTSSVASVAAGPSLASWMFIAVSSRVAMAAVAILQPPARNDGLGSLASGAGAVHLLPGLILIGILAGFDPKQSAIAIVVISATAFSTAAMAQRKIGGQTGDVLGAVQFISETAGWMTIAAIATATT